MMKSRQSDPCQESDVAPIGLVNESRRPYSPSNFNPDGLLSWTIRHSNYGVSIVLIYVQPLSLIILHVQGHLEAASGILYRFGVNGEPAFRDCQWLIW